MKDSGLVLSGGSGAKLPLRFKRLALYSEACSVNPPGIDFPKRTVAEMFIILFLMVLISVSISYRYLIVLALPVFIYAVVYAVFLNKILRALKLSYVKSTIFLTLLFFAGASGGICVRYLLFK